MAFAYTMVARTTTIPSPFGKPDIPKKPPYIKCISHILTRSSKLCFMASNQHVMSCYDVLCYAMLCYAMLDPAMLAPVMLVPAMLNPAMLAYGILAMLAHARLC